ncbi:hypothetical protein [Variovorax paradoxus]|uniref:Transmembrane protein n=1 Tax=Variovorax paradoxus TaxID=34073 RepID=A0A6I6HIT5_VARPD|nr:hypothetical protein [Variovorax paradoxus]QGW81897.1 hypothetical protein GOQ09_09975 [Variovorax paradoxus]
MSRLSGSNSTSTSHWGSPLVIAQLIYFSAMVGLGVFLPDSVLEGNAWKRDFSDFMASFVPQIDRITALDIEPGVNRFYFSILWATSPALFGLLFLNIYRTRSTLRKLWDTPLRKVLLSMCGLAMMLAWTQHLWFVESSMRLSLFLFGSTIGRSFFAQLAFYIGAVFCIAALMVWCVGCLNGYISRNGKEKHHE